MSYLVYARKYRPQTFDDVVAQDHVTQTLRNAIKNERVGSGYLFCGPRGTGKTTVARIVAMAINCPNDPPDVPCAKCSTCREIAAGTSLDVLEIDAASNTGVDDMRTLRENVRYLPTSGKKRIYIIDEVHRLSGSAFDALLKTLEEPPEHVMFIFATTEPLKVPETILSRTQRFDFRRVSIDDLSTHLRTIAEKDSLKINDGALRLLARKADGSVRDSLSLLDQIAAFSSGRITEKDVVAALGLVDSKFLFELIEGVAAADRGLVLTKVKELFDSGIEVSDFVFELLDHLRTLMVLSTDAKANVVLGLDESELAEYKKQVEYFSLGDILRFIKTVSDLNADLKSGLDPRLLLETAVVKMAQMESTVRFEDILAQLGAAGISADANRTPKDGDPDFFAGNPPAGRSVSQPQPSGNQTPPARATSSVAAAPPPVKSTIQTHPTRVVNLPQVKSEWDSVLLRVRKHSPMLASQLGMAELAFVKDGHLGLHFSPAEATSMQLVSKPGNVKLIMTCLREHFKTNLSITFDIDEKKAVTGDRQAKSSPAVDPQTLVAASPRLKSLIDRIDGDIIGIKQAKK